MGGSWKGRDEGQGPEEFTPSYRKGVRVKWFNCRRVRSSWKPNGQNVWGLRVREMVLSWKAL